MIETVWTFGNENLTDAHAIRRVVFIEEQHIDEADELDGTDAACLHLVVYDEGVPAATGRVMVGREAFVIGRIAVLPAYRGRKLGALTVRLLIHACTQMGGDQQIVHAQISARGFYEKLGFTAIGDVYEDAGIPHITMTHNGGCEDCGSCENNHCTARERMAEA